MKGYKDKEWDDVKMSSYEDMRIWREDIVKIKDIKIRR